MSVDAAALASRLSTHAAATSGRPTRFLFSRGSSAQPANREDEAVAESEAEDYFNLDGDATIRAKSEGPRRAKLLLPGHLIESATTDSNSPGSSFIPSPSLATSPPWGPLFWPLDLLRFLLHDKCVSGFGRCFGLSQSPAYLIKAPGVQLNATRDRWST